MIGEKYGSGTDFLKSLDISKTIASTKRVPTLRLSDVFKVFYSSSDKFTSSK